ncbi:hypothetical protein [Thermococcus peptonophilus]|nr:hypothetical protein [Thermococcus peptonophilus]
MDWNIFTILLLNKDVVSERLSAWVSSISDTIITFRSSLEEGVLEERMVILRTPSPSFEPTAYNFKLSTEDGSTHHMDFKKVE